MSMNGHGPIGTVPDRGAVRARQQEKSAVPDYDPGTPEFAVQVRVALGPNAAPSFTDALDRAALILDNDGSAIERRASRSAPCSGWTSRATASSRPL